MDDIKLFAKNENLQSRYKDGILLRKKYATHIMKAKNDIGRKE